MAAKWSNEYIVAEHKDLQASTMALDSTGQYVLLAGRRCLAIVDVDNPSTVVKRVPRQSKWEVGTAEWNPHPQCSHLCAISSNQRTEILTWDSADLTTSSSLRSHTRVVSDLNWHRFDPAILATCSVDTFINVWDIRDHRKPSMSFSAVVGATQVKWNRVSGHLLATAHEGDVRLWDSRKGNTPIQYIAAHLHKIHGLDWSVSQDHQLATSSQDCTVKFFDVNNPRTVQNSLKTVCPVWKARYTPFGNGMTTTQLRRGENSLLLWSLRDLTNPVHTFVGHTDVVLDFDWKRSRNDDEDYQLVTWSKDQSLRIWRVDSNLQKLCGYEADIEPPMVYGENDSSINISSMDSVSAKNDREIETGLEVGEETILIPPVILPDPLRLPSLKNTQLPAALLSNTLSPSVQRKKQSVSSMNGDLHLLTLDKKPYSFAEEVEQIQSLDTAESVSISDVDEVKRNLIVNIRTAKHQVFLHVTCPLTYPNNVIPSFQFGKCTTFDSGAKSKVYKVIKNTAQLCTKRGAPCLESCIQQLIVTVNQLAINDKPEPEPSKTLSINTANGTSSSYRLPQNGHGHSSFLQANGLFSSINHNQDYNIPYARSSGARFCSAGMLICFGRPSYLRRVSNKTSESSTTPRSLFVNQQQFGLINKFEHKLSGASNGTSYGMLYPPVAQGPSDDPTVSISMIYNQDRRQRSRNTTKPKNRLSTVHHASDAERRGATDVRQHKVGMVTIYDASGLLPLQLELAERYVDTDIQWMCNQNAAVAAQFGRKDLEKVWSLGSLLAVPSLITDDVNKDIDTPWAQNPFGRKLLHAIIEHYVKQRDIQTVAMLCCAFGCKGDSQDLFRRKSRSENGSPGESPYHTIQPGDTTLDSWNVTGLKQIRSNSWSDSLEDFRLGNPATGSGTSNSRPLAVTSIFPAATNTSVSAVDPSEELKDRDFRLLDPKFNYLCDNYRRCYADILYRWGLLEARCLVLKYLSVPLEPHRGVEFVSECYPCRQTVRGPQCMLCKRLCMHCSICRIVVKGSASFCLACGHGGHSLHMARWFAEESVCPTGCGCHCLSENSSVLSV